MQRIFPLLLLLVPLALHAESGIWLETAVEKSISKHWSAEISLGHRREHDFRQASRCYGAAQVAYRWNSHWKFSAGYQYIHDYKAEQGKINLNEAGQINGYNVDEAYWRPRHRVLAEASYKWKINKRWSLSLRERYQYTHTPEASTTEWKYRKADAQGTYVYGGEPFRRLTSEAEIKRASDKHYLRSRLKLEYKPKHCPLSPFATYELANNLAEGFDIVRHRFTLGGEWQLGKQHSLSTAYLHQIGHNDNDDAAPLHIIDISYKFKF